MNKFSKKSIPEFLKSSLDEQVESVWFDWFCEKTELRGKTVWIVTFLRAIADSPRFDKTKCYVFFRNNCSDILWDDFRICDMQTDKVLITVVPPQIGVRPHVAFLAIGSLHPLYFDSWKDIVAWFMCPKEFQQKKKENMSEKESAANQPEIAEEAGIKLLLKWAESLGEQNERAHDSERFWRQEAMMFSVGMFNAMHIIRLPGKFDAEKLSDVLRVLTETLQWRERLTEKYAV